MMTGNERGSRWKEIIGAPSLLFTFGRQLNHVDILIRSRAECSSNEENAIFEEGCAAMVD